MPPPLILASFFEVTVAQTSIIGTTLTITMSLPGGSTVFNSFTYAGCTPEGAVICPTEASSLHFQAFTYPFTFVIYA